MIVRNPILPGFHPDPSIVRVGQDYYLATSTFEWFPGVQLYHTRNLVDWKLIGHGLTRTSQLDLKGVPDSCGVWAPCLSHHEGTFYLVYTVVQSFDGVWKDCPNYMVSAKDPAGPWSEPIFLSSRGFDGSLFHGSDGRKFFLSMRVDHRGARLFGGIEMQEYDPERKRLTGPVHFLTAGSELGITEGPHLYEIDGYFYLVLAEGGTDYGHAISVARSRDLLGPYEFHPDNPIVSSAGEPRHPLQRAGHGDLFFDARGNGFVVFLVGRPHRAGGRCILGRETALERLVWEGGWPRTESGSRLPRVEWEWNTSGEAPRRPYRQCLNFGTDVLPAEFQSLRVPMTEDWCSLRKRPGFLTLRGRQSLSSTHSQSLVARRVQHFDLRAECVLHFDPEDFMQMAGLVFYYNTGHYHYLFVSWDPIREMQGVGRISSDNFRYEEEMGRVFVEKGKPVLLQGVLHGSELQFYAGSPEDTVIPVGARLDAGILSDDHVRDGGERYRPAFTGCFVGMCCQDLARGEKEAHFARFDYQEGEAPY